MADAPLISVVMANHDGARFLPAAIASLQAQTEPRWELIVADDGSTDDSCALVEAAARADPRLRLTRTAAPRSGPGAARNAALAEARGDWIAVMDSDDLLEPERLRRLLAEAEARGAAIVADNQVLFWDDSGARRLYIPRTLLPEARWIGLEAFVDSNRQYSKMPSLGYLKPLIRTELIRGLGLTWDEDLRIGEDFVFLARLMAGSGERLRLIPDPLYLYRRHETSTSHRLRPADLHALIAADERFVADHPRLSAAALRSFARRRRTFETLLVYDGVLSDLKRGALVAALGRLARHPQAGPLLAQPVRDRMLRRMRAWQAARAARSG